MILATDKSIGRIEAPSVECTVSDNGAARLIRSTQKAPVEGTHLLFGLLARPPISHFSRV